MYRHGVWFFHSFKNLNNMGEGHYNCAECEEIYSDYKPHETCAGCDERLCESCAEECRVEMPGHHCSECKAICTGEHGDDIDVHTHQPKGCECFESSVVFACSNCQNGHLSSQEKWAMLEHCLAKLGKTSDEVRDELRASGVLVATSWTAVTQEEVDAAETASPPKKRKEDDDAVPPPAKKIKGDAAEEKKKAEKPAVDVMSLEYIRNLLANAPLGGRCMKVNVQYPACTEMGTVISSVIDSPRSSHGHSSIHAKIDDAFHDYVMQFDWSPGQALFVGENIDKEQTHLVFPGQPNFVNARDLINTSHYQKMKQ